MLTNHRVTKVDVDHNYLKCENGKQICFEKLIICTGSKPLRLPDSIPGSSLERIFYLRSEFDFSQLVYTLEELKKKEKMESVAILGGGYLGIEMATALLDWGFRQVHLIIRQRYLFEKQKWISTFRDKVQDEVVKRGGKRLVIHAENTIQMIVPSKIDESVLGAIVLEDGAVIPAQLLCCCIGSEPIGVDLLDGKNVDTRSLKFSQNVHGHVGN